MISDTTRSSLLAAVRDGNEVGWEEFHRTYRPLILARGGQLRLSPPERDELLQLVMLEFFKASRTFVYDRAKGRFRDYLRAIIYHQACAIMRARHDAELPLAETDELPDEQPDCWEAEWQEHLLRQAFAELKNKVEPTTLQSYHLFVVENRPAREVARLLDIKANAVYQHKSRVEAMLREIAMELDR